MAAPVPVPVPMPTALAARSRYWYGYGCQGSQVGGWAANLEPRESSTEPQIQEPKGQETAAPAVLVQLSMPDMPQSLPRYANNPDWCRYNKTRVTQFSAVFVQTLHSRRGFLEGVRNFQGSKGRVPALHSNASRKPTHSPPTPCCYHPNQKEKGLWSATLQEGGNKGKLGSGQGVPFFSLSFSEWEGEWTVLALIREWCFGAGFVAKCNAHKLSKQICLSFEQGFGVLTLKGRLSGRHVFLLCQIRY